MKPTRSRGVLHAPRGVRMHAPSQEACMKALITVLIVIQLLAGIALGLEGCSKVLGGIYSTHAAIEW